MIERTRPIIAAVHPNLINELKIRQEQLQEETGRPTKGGLTIFSQIAAEELRSMRLSGDALCKEIKTLSKINPVEMNIEGDKRMFVPFERYKELFIYASALNKKKDQNQIRLEIQKIKGLKKNEVKFLW